jgi:hypothetical protein
MRVTPKLDLNGNIRASVSSGGKSRTPLENVFDPGSKSPNIRKGPHSDRRLFKGVRVRLAGKTVSATVSS